MASRYKIDNMFGKAVAAHHAGRYDEALERYRKLLRVDPRHCHAMHYQGLVHYQRGDHRAALDCILASISMDASVPEFHLNLGNTWKALGEQAQAHEVYRFVATSFPGSAAARYAAGICAYHERDYPGAKAALEEVLATQPNHAEARFQLGRALVKLGETAAGIHHLETYLATRGSDPDGWHALAQVYLACGDDRAVAAFERALAIKGNSAELLNGHGCALEKAGRYSQAEQCFRTALPLAAKPAAVLGNLGGCLSVQGRHAEAQERLLESVALEPDNPTLLSNWLMSLNYLPSSNYRTLFEAHVRAAAASCRLTAAGPSPARPAPRLSSGDAKVRIGLLSPDFHRHPVGYFSAPLIERLMREQFTVLCYHDSSRHDAQTARLARHADAWLPVQALDDDALAERIERDRVEILIDLAGHTAGNRLPLLSRRPAPVQVGYLGYPCTTGLPGIDFRITDRVADPEGSEAWSSERLLRMPGSYFCYRPHAEAPPVAAAPAGGGGGVTFGSFNNFSKITDACLDTWAETLHRVPGSRLLLKYRGANDAQLVAAKRQAFDQRGVDPARILFSEWRAGHRDHLAEYAKVNIALDTLPFTGATTTCDALWMGVPVVTCAGDSHAARMGASILAASDTGLEAADSLGAYVAAAVNLAADTDRLQALRGSIRMRMSGSPLMDEQRFAGDFGRLLQRALGRQSY